MPKHGNSPRRSDIQSGVLRKLVDCVPYRTTGGRHLESLTLYPIEHESHNEKHALWLLPLCHDVLRIFTQASRESYSDEEVIERFHIPDITVETPTGSLSLEIKSLQWLFRDESLNKYQQVARGYLDQKKRFAFLVDAQIEQNPMFGSVKILRRYMQCEIIPETQGKALQLLQGGPLNIADLMGRSSIRLVDVFVLIARRVICFDWSQPLNESTLVSLPDQPFEGLKLENILRSTRYGGLLAELALGRRPTDQSIMADAPLWRQFRSPPGPFQFIGGFPGGLPLRDIGIAESCTGTIWNRRDRAPGAYVSEDELAQMEGE